MLPFQVSAVYGKNVLNVIQYDFFKNLQINIFEYTTFLDFDRE